MHWTCQHLPTSLVLRLAFELIGGELNITQAQPLSYFINVIQCQPSELPSSSLPEQPCFLCGCRERNHPVATRRPACQLARCSQAPVSRLCLQPSPPPKSDDALSAARTAESTSYGVTGPVVCSGSCAIVALSGVENAELEADVTR